MEISENSIERDSATAWRMTSELLATSLGVVLFGLVLAQLAPEGSSTDAERRIAYFAGSLVICCFVVVPGFIATCCVPERPEYCVQRADGPIASADRSEQSNLGPTAAAPGFFGEWLAGLKLAFSCPSYLVLMLCFLCSGLTFQLTSNNLNLYLRHTLDVADQFQIITLVVLGSSFCFIFMIYMLHRYLFWEKHRCYQLGLMMWFPITVSFYFAPLAMGAPWLIYVIAGGAGVGTATVFLLPAMMLPDTVDDGELRSGEHHEGLFYAFFVFFNKLAAGLALMGSNLALEAAGYVTQTEPDVEPEQPPEVGLVLRILMSAPTSVLVLIAVVGLQWYPITEETRRNTRAELDLRHAKAKQASGHSE